MSMTYDFQLISNTAVSGMSLIMAQNEDAFSYLTDELGFGTFQDGSAPLDTRYLPDFNETAEKAHFACELV